MSQTRAQYTQRRLLTVIIAVGAAVDTLRPLWSMNLTWPLRFDEEIVFPDNKRYLPQAPRRIGNSPQIVIMEVQYEPQLMPRPPPVERRLLMAS